MAKAKFQGYARGKGFQQSDPGYVGLQRMQERDDRVIRDLKDNLKDLENRNRQAENDMRDSQRNQEQNMKDIFIEEDVYRNQKQALDQNISTLRQNKQAAISRAKAKGDEMETLAKFSQTLATGLLQKREKDIAATVDDAYHKQLIYGPTPIEREQQGTAEELLKQYGHQIQTTADIAARNGALPRSVEQIRTFDQATDYGRLKAVSKMAGEEFLPHAQQELSRLGITDPEGAAVALKVIHLDYLRERNLYGLSSDFLMEAHDDMRKARNIILGGLVDKEVEAKGKARVTQARTAYEGNKNEDNWNNFWRMKSTAKGENTHTATNFMLMEVMTDPILTPNLEEVKNYRIRYNDGTFDKQTWGERYANRMPEIIREREKKEIAISNKQKDLEKVEQFKVETLTKEWIDKEWDQNSETLKARENELEMMGYNTDFLKYAYARSIQAQDEERIKAELDEISRAGALGLNDKDLVLRLSDKQDKDYYMDLINQNEKLREATGRSDKQVSQGFLNLLKTSLEQEQVLGTDFAFTLQPALAEANKQFAERRFNNLRYRGMNASEATIEAHQYVQEKILSKEQEFAVVNGKRDPSIKENSPLKKAIFFKNYVSPEMYVRGYTSNTSDHVRYQQNIKEINKNPKLISEKLYYPEDRLRAQVEAYSQGKSIEIPQIYYDISRQLRISPLEVFKKQIKALDPNIKFTNESEDFRDKWRKDTNDPQGLELIKKIDSLDGALRAYEVIYNDGANNPRFMSPRTQRLIIPSEPTKDIENVPDVLKSLIQDSKGAVTSKNIQFKAKEGDRFLIPSDDNSRNWLIENGRDYGWVFDIDTGNFNFMEF
tara:strand:+ start:4029 stop:6524 length:2496 start_codon:yes stop_codon:yes gene_type:complete